MTWWLWLVLVIGALVVFALIGLSLWRRAKGLLVELRSLEQLSAPLAAAGGVEMTPLTVTPGFLAEPAELAAASEQRRRNRLARGQRRADRASAARGRWRRLGLR